MNQPLDGKYSEITVTLENLSTITKIKSFPFLDLGRSSTKSMEMSVQGEVGIGNGEYKP